MMEAELLSENLLRLKAILAESVAQKMILVYLLQVIASNLIYS